MHVDSYRFGRIVVDGVVYTRDVLLLGERVVSPWWRTAGGHVFAPDDLAELISTHAAVVVLGTGYFGRVEVRPETLEALSAVGSEVVVRPTRQAVEELNRRAAGGETVSAALHLTC